MRKHADVSKCSKGPFNLYLQIRAGEGEYAELMGGQKNTSEEHQIAVCTKATNRSYLLDMELIWEAFNVAAETGLSPRQLLERIYELEKEVDQWVDKAGQYFRGQKEEASDEV
jgi:hypothetical protein